MMYGVVVHYVRFVKRMFRVHVTQVCFGKCIINGTFAHNQSCELKLCTLDTLESLLYNIN